MGFLRRRGEGYKAAWRVEKYRAAAVRLREQDPESYAQALAQANGSEAEAAAHRDPDAYVALVLAAFEDAERTGLQGYQDDGHASQKTDLAFAAYLEAVGGFDALVDGVQAHARMLGQELNDAEAIELIDAWRIDGLPQNLSVGEYLDAKRRTSSETPEAQRQAQGLRAVYDKDANEYLRVVAALLENRAGRPQLSRVMRDVLLRAMIPVHRYIDENWSFPSDPTPVLERFGPLIGEVIGSAYALASSEEWDELDRDRATAVLDTVIGSHIARPSLDRAVKAVDLFASPEVPGWTATIHDCSAYARMHWFYAAHALTPEDDSGALDDPAVHGKVAGASMMAWRIGIALAVLELLGELPTYEDDNVTGAISDFDYWPQIDLDEIYRAAGVFFAEAHAEKGVSQQYYPNRVVRRLVALRMIEAAASITPEVLNDEDAASAIAAIAEGDFTENTRLDEDLELYLARQHLKQLVDAVIRALSAE